MTNPSQKGISKSTFGITLEMYHFSTSLSQSWVHINACAVVGRSELHSWSSTLPPLLKANSGVTFDIGITKIFRAIIASIGYFDVWTFHQFNMSKSTLHLSKSDLVSWLWEVSWRNLSNPFSLSTVSPGTS